MAEMQQPQCALFALPNEILLDVFDLFPTTHLMRMTTTCHKLHKLVLRIVYNRLQIAAGLGGYGLYLKCHPPPKEWTAPKMFCDFLGTDGLDDFACAIQDESEHMGQVKSVFGLFTRYRPKRQEPPVRVSYNPMTGARRYESSSTADGYFDERPMETVTVDAHELFSQLTTHVLLGWRERERGILVGMHQISAGWIRVWRDWLVKHCESRSWADGEAVVVHSTAEPASIARTTANPSDLRKDPCILWLGDSNAGVKIKVKEKISRANANPFASDTEEAVSYVVEFEEVLVRTSHLLIMLEEAQKCMDSGSGKAIVFGSFRG